MIYISLGSNLGHRLHYLQRAVTMLKETCLRDLVCSPVLETECLLRADSPASWNIPYLNMVVAGVSDLAPLELLGAIKKIERELGRPAHYERWSPRVIDLDILLWDDTTIAEPTLKIPHPELSNRPFLTHLLAMMGNKVFEAASSPPCFQKSMVAFPRLVGIVNMTADSFSDGGKFDSAEKAIPHILQLMRDGATVIEIGAQSTRAGAHLLTADQEFECLEPALRALEDQLRNRSITLSLDSFRAPVIRKVLEHYPVAWINDVSGQLDDVILAFIAEKKSRLCLMHSLTIPADKTVTLPLMIDCVEVIKDWAQGQIDRLGKLGFTKSSILIDPGIGFGKSPYQDAEIIRRAGEFKSLGVDILFGHSRKSFNQLISTYPAPLRDVETLAASASLAASVDYLRVHNVVDHMRYFVAAAVVGSSPHVP